MGFLRTFTGDLSPRASGTEQERAAAGFLAAEFEKLSFGVLLQSFTVDLMLSKVRVGPQETAFDSFPMTLSARGEVSGPLVSVGRALESDLRAEGVQGKVALIERGGGG